MSYDPANGYRANPSRNAPGMPSSQTPVKGMPRPDISWWQDGRLWKIIELKFPTAGGGVDGQTPMQESGAYRAIARANGLDPDSDVINLNVGDHCDCEASKSTPGAPC